MEKFLYDSLYPFLCSELGEEGSGHGVDHALRVMYIAQEIATVEGGDVRLIATAALLHDCADHKLFSNPSLQIEKISKLLLSLHFSVVENEAVLYIIQHISYRQGENPPLTTLEAMIVRDADRLDAMGAMGIIRTITYGAVHSRPFYRGTPSPEFPSLIDRDTTLAHFYDKLLKLKELMHTATARRMAAERESVMQQFLSAFFREIHETSQS